MTTYTTPHFANGASDRNTRPEATTRARPASAAPYRTAGVTNEAALMADGQTPDWQPGASRGMPKAAIGALGAALVGGVALAIVLMAPGNKVVKHTMPDPIAQAAASNESAARKVSDDTDATISQIEKQAPAAGNTATAPSTAGADTQNNPAADVRPAATPAPVASVTPKAPPVATAPVARATKPKAASTQAAPPATRQQAAPAATPDPASTVSQPADVQPPAMQQTPDTPTVTPSTPAPTPDTPPAPTPAPAQ